MSQDPTSREAAPACRRCGRRGGGFCVKRHPIAASSTGRIRSALPDDPDPDADAWLVA